MFVRPPTPYEFFEEAFVHELLLLCAILNMLSRSSPATKLHSITEKAIDIEPCIDAVHSGDVKKALLKQALPGGRKGGDLSLRQRLDPLDSSL